MNRLRQPPTRVAIATQPSLPESSGEALLLADDLRQRGVAADIEELQNQELQQRVRAGQYDLLVALGGDGTMLRAGHLCGPAGVPVLGINLGRLGFLTEIDRKDWRPMLERLAHGEYWLEERMMLRALHQRAGQTLGTWDVLNEVYVGRGEQVRPVHLTTYLDDHFLTTYVADGLLAATPTGSTAYALAVGGPILPPQLRNILIIPIAPHLSVDRAIILAEGSCAAVTVHSSHQAVLCVDGQPPLPLADGDSLRVEASEHTVHFVRFQDAGYFYRNLTSHMNQNPSTGNAR